MRKKISVSKNSNREDYQLTTHVAEDAQAGTIERQEAGVHALVAGAVAGVYGHGEVTEKEHRKCRQEPTVQNKKHTFLTRPVWLASWSVLKEDDSVKPGRQQSY